jgi:hypothetical protein
MPWWEWALIAAGVWLAIDLLFVVLWMLAHR